jgi:osmotically-inducible protein OsmY
MKSWTHGLSQLVCLLALAVLLPGCAPALIGGTAVGISVIHDRRTTATVLEDQKVELVAEARLNDHKDLSKHSQVSFTCYNRVMLITGRADSPDVKARIAEMVGRFPELVRVVDEVQVGLLSGLEQLTDDIYLTSKVKLALFEINDIPTFDPTRVTVTSDHGVVYLMGLVTQREAAAVVDKVRYINGVQRVVKVFEYVEPET